MNDIQAEYDILLQKLANVQEQAALLKKHLSARKKDNQDFMTLFMKTDPEMSVDKYMKALHHATVTLIEEAGEDLKKLPLMEEYASVCEQQRLLRSCGVQLTALLQKAEAKKVGLLSQRLLGGSVSEAIAKYNSRVTKISEAAVNPQEVRGLLLADFSKTFRAASAAHSETKNGTAAKSAASATPEKTKSLAVGSIIEFGSYPQHKDGKKAPIEWQVLAKEKDRVLLLSKYALDCQQYHPSRTGVTWETCSLRQWLNENFLKAAFNAQEQKMILTTTVTADRNLSYGTDPGKNTTDKVFLLSIPEANKYFESAEARRCAPTDYAIGQGAWTDDDDYKTGGKAACWWWLRSPGYYPDGAAYVNNVGSAHYYGVYVNDDDSGVRPALWINLDA